MLLTDMLLLDYKRCQRRAYLNVYGDATEKAPERDFLLKLRQDSQAHIEQVLRTFYPDSQHLESAAEDWRSRAQETHRLMAQGVDCIVRGVLAQSYQDIPRFTAEETDATALTHHLETVMQLRMPTLPSDGEFSSNEQAADTLPANRIDASTLLITNPGPPITLVGRPHLLIKQPGQSKFGNWLYEPISIQFGRRPKPEYKLVAAFHAQLLAHRQESWPTEARLILRQQNTYCLDLSLWLPRLQELLDQYLHQLRQKAEPDVFISRQRCSLCHWKPHCYAIAQSQQHLSLVPGVTPHRYEHLQALGVGNVTSLADACAVSMAEVMGTEVARTLKQQAQAIVHNQPLRKSHPKKTLPSLPTAEVEFYFDIEAEPERNLDYLLGVLVVDHIQQREEFISFLAETPEAEAEVWQAFLALTQRYPQAPIYHFSEYEVETIKRLGDLYQTSFVVRHRLTKRCIDLHRYVTHSVLLPVENYSLKTLANWLDFQWRDQEASGDQSVCWYDQWLKTGDRSLLTAILRYNEDDCRATYHLKAWLSNFLQQEQDTAPQPSLLQS